MSTRRKQLVSEITDTLQRVRDLDSPALKRRCLVDVAKLAGVFHVEGMLTTDLGKSNRLLQDADGLDQLVAELENEGW